MNDIKWFFIILVVLACLPLQSKSLQSNADILIIEAGDNTSLAGAIQRNQEIRIETGATLTVIADDGTPAHVGSINLIAPQIYIDGTIHAVAAGHNTRGAGGAPNGSDGGGGAGYGGAGGRGHDDGTSPIGGAAGSTYNTVNLDEVGSHGWGADFLQSRSGYGGGTIRLDAISLTLGANALLDARGNTTAISAVGGGSGGCIYLNGINTILAAGSQIDVSGGIGGSAFTPWGAAGGGGGGRIKIVLHPGYDVASAILTNAPGSGGGGNAQPGEFGNNRLFNAPSPNLPTLITPNDGEVVGRSPTFTFSATDLTHSKFLKYQVIMSLDSGYTSLTYTASQLNPDSGWGGKSYYASGEIAGYTLPTELVGGTTYYWSVSVTSNNGVTWVDSGSQSMTALTNQAPEIPVIIHPSDDLTQVSALPAFQVLGSDFEGDNLIFRITLSRASDLSNPQVFAETYPGWDQSMYIPGGSYVGVTATCQLQPADALVPNTEYYWKVACLDQPFNQQSESVVYHFTTTRVLPNAPTLLLPADQYQVPNNQVNFQFQVSSNLGNTLSGRVEISENNFETILYTVDQQHDQTGWSQIYYSSGETASVTLPASTVLEKNKTYTWRATAFDGQYAGPLSTQRSFSLADHFGFQMIRMLPNPAKSVDTVQFYVRLTIDGALTIRIFNKLGKQIDQIYYDGIGGAAGNYINYNISDYATGVYFYTIEAESIAGSQKQTKKFAVIN